MLELNSYLAADKIIDVVKYTDLRFRDKNKLSTPEALTLYEQRYLHADEIKKLCEEFYGFELSEPLITYMPESILRSFSGSELVPVTFMPMSNKIVAVYIPEIPYQQVTIPEHSIELVPTTLYFYLEQYQRMFGTNKILQEIPSKMLMDMIVKEGIELGAADITIATVGCSSHVYYNVRKKKVHSNRIFSYECMLDIIKYLCIKSPFDSGSRSPKYTDVDLTKDYRGRVVINTKHKGYLVTIRLLPNAVFDHEIEDLGLSTKTVSWLTEEILDEEKGLRLIVGPTMSGKNTTALALLRQLVLTDRFKIVSVEMPVESELPGVEQINTERIEEYDANIKSLIRLNPDFVYITEMNDMTGEAAIRVTNTGKCVLSTIHANNVPDTISRLVTITGLTSDHIIQALHSIVYQILVRNENEDKVYPKNRYIRFTSDIKHQLYGKELGEIIKIISVYEEGDSWTFS